MPTKLHEALFTVSKTSSIPLPRDPDNWDKVEFLRRAYWQGDLISDMEVLSTYKKYFDPDKGWKFAVEREYPPTVSKVSFQVPCGGMAAGRNGRWFIHFLLGNPPVRYDRWKEAKDAARDRLMGRPVLRPEHFRQVGIDGYITQVLTIKGLPKMEHTRSPTLHLTKGEYKITFWKPPRTPKNWLVDFN